MFTTTVDVLRAPAVRESRYASKPVADWGTATVVASGVLVSLQPQTSSEGPVERPQTTTLWLLVSEPPGDLDLQAGDRVRVPALDLVLEVDGQPGRWMDIDVPDEVDHVQATLRKVAG